MRNRSTTNPIFALLKILGRHWYLHHLFVDSSKEYDSVLRNRMYDTLTIECTKMHWACKNKSVGIKGYITTLRRAVFFLIQPGVRIICTTCA